MWEEGVHIYNTLGVPNNYPRQIAIVFKIDEYL